MGPKLLHKIALCCTFLHLLEWSKTVKTHQKPRRFYRFLDGFHTVLARFWWQFYTQFAHSSHIQSLSEGDTANIVYMYTYTILLTNCSTGNTLVLQLLTYTYTIVLLISYTYFSLRLSAESNTKLLKSGVVHRLSTGPGLSTGYSQLIHKLSTGPRYPQVVHRISTELSTGSSINKSNAYQHCSGK